MAEAIVSYTLLCFLKSAISYQLSAISYLPPSFRSLLAQFFISCGDYAAVLNSKSIRTLFGWHLASMNRINGLQDPFHFCGWELDSRELKHEATDILVHKALRWQYPLTTGSYPCCPCQTDCDSIENSPCVAFMSKEAFFPTVDWDYRDSSRWCTKDCR